jgi:GTP-binding protein
MLAELDRNVPLDSSRQIEPEPEEEFDVEVVWVRE